ncbi:hypothetical protein MNBD_GAMMA09-790 [hydrothermal vent metagenome]|uniref:VWFA domain-containing protein n=1 Tax=hydrothermal vent metagenome TaxID=652676 RepID=A0A3B0XAW7_9ZZZZ
MQNQKPLNFLDLIPDEIYRRLVTHSYRHNVKKQNQHQLEIRCVCVLNIRNYLLNGVELTLQEINLWLDEPLASELYRYLSDNKIVRSARGNAGVTDELIFKILDWLDKMALLSRDLSSSILPEEPALLHHSESTEPDSGFGGVPLSSQHKKRLLHRFIGWDTDKGDLSDIDINLLFHTHELIHSSRQLQAIIRLIGRRQTRKYNEAATAGYYQKSTQGKEQNNEFPDEYSLNSVTGVCTGDDISKMLPSELALLTHKKFRKLWHARRAENQLMSYHFQGVLSSHTPIVAEKSIVDDAAEKHIVRVNGPMVLCVDTSASMNGKAELIARAVALETVRVAQLENRLCYLYCFSAEGQIREFEFKPEQGWQAVLDFLKVAYVGGTDINGVLLRAIEKLDESKWKNADVLLVSDGCFKVNKEVQGRVQSLNGGMRIFGLQTSSWQSDEFSRVCHETFRLGHVI